MIKNAVAMPCCLSLGSGWSTSMCIAFVHWAVWGMWFALSGKLSWMMQNCRATWIPVVQLIYRYSSARLHTCAKKTAIPSICFVQPMRPGGATGLFVACGQEGLSCSTSWVGSTKDLVLSMSDVCSKSASFCLFCIIQFKLGDQKRQSVLRQATSLPACY